MKVESIRIENFKLFDHLEVSFKNKTLNEVSNRFLVLGDNGAGKTTLLQSIALMLGLATRQVRTVSEFDWIGFVPGRYSRWGTPNIKMLVTFTQEELDATHWITEKWYESRSAEFRQTHPFEPSGNSAKVELTLKGERYDAGSRAEMIQFQGRQKYSIYCRQIRLSDLGLPRFQPFWFDQFRNLGSNPDIREANGESTSENSGRVSFDFGTARLRRYLNGWKLGQSSRDQPYRVDYLMNLENLYKKFSRTFFCW